MKIPFGLYKNQDISNIPSDYLDWIKDKIAGQLKNVVDDEIKRRKNPAAGITKAYDPVTGANRLIEVILKLPERFFQEPFTLNTTEGKIHVRLERIPNDKM